jgi:D-amino-acid dehydrogenase
MVPLAQYSRDLLRDLRERLDLAYDERAKGLLQLFRHRKQLDGTGKDVAILDRFGIPYELLDVEGCVRAEPALGLVKGKIAGGLRLLGDETGDCFKFTNALAALCRQLGVEFRYGTRIDGIATGDGRVTGIATDQGTLTGDAYVVALGSRSPLLLRRVGIDLPVYPVKGYSITVPITDPAGAPEATIMDEAHKVAITRLGDRIRNRPGPLRVRQHFSNTVSPLAQIEMSPSPLSPWRAPAAADPHSSARRHATSHVRALVPGLANDNASNTKRVGVAGAPQGSSCSP